MEKNHAIIQQMIESETAALVQSRRDLSGLAGVILGQGFIVLAHAGFPLDFTVENGVALHPQRSRFAAQVLRMTKPDAERVAAAVYDGANRPGRAIHLRDALLAEVAEREELLRFLKEAGGFSSSIDVHAFDCKALPLEDRV